VFSWDVVLTAQTETGISDLRLCKGSDELFLTDAYDMNSAGRTTHTAG